MAEKPSFNDFESDEAVAEAPAWAIKLREILRYGGIQVVRSIPISLSAIFFVLAWSMRQLDVKLYQQLHRGKTAEGNGIGDMATSRPSGEQSETGDGGGSEVPLDDIEGKGDDDQMSTPKEDSQRSTDESAQEDSDIIEFDVEMETIQDVVDRQIVNGKEAKDAAEK